ncbi:MAG: helix-turn-helix domain-containing protein, partial [Dissulfuribacterales bacterium]
MDDLSLGEYLRQGREKMELTLEEVSLHTNISKKMLEAMETDSWHEFP